MTMKKHTHKRPHKHAPKHPKPPHRNAAPPTSAPRSRRKPPTEEETPLRRLGYTAAGAAGTALVGSFLATRGWAPKTIAGALAAVGAGLAWRGDEPMVRSIGAGTMSAAGSQLALMVIDDREHKVAPAQKVAQAVKKPANADELPPGALESAFERARTRLALSSEGPDDIG
jgi:hypothetical protein